jgi:hypothetical protein
VILSARGDEMDRIVVVSGNGHMSAPLDEYKPYRSR